MAKRKKLTNAGGEANNASTDAERKSTAGGEADDASTYAGVDAIDEEREKSGVGPGRERRSADERSG